MQQSAKFRGVLFFREFGDDPPRKFRPTIQPSILVRLECHAYAQQYGGDGVFIVYYMCIRMSTKFKELSVNCGFMKHVWSVQRKYSLVFPPL